MRSLYSSPATALRDALRHAVERGGMSSLGVLHQGVLSPAMLTGTDATAQAVRAAVRAAIGSVAMLGGRVFMLARMWSGASAAAGTAAEAIAGAGSAAESAAAAAGAGAAGAGAAGAGAAAGGGLLSRMLGGTLRFVNPVTVGAYLIAHSESLNTGEDQQLARIRAAEGTSHSSIDLLAHGPLIVTFYRGVWCPYCNFDLQAIQAALPELESRRAQLVAISPQTAPNSRRSQRENHVSFPILSGPGNEVAAAFGIRFKLPDYLADLYKTVFKNDLAVANGESSWTLPMPARFVIGQDGVILYAEVNPDYTRRPDPEELLPMLDRVKEGTV